MLPWGAVATSGTQKHVQDRKWILGLSPVCPALTIGLRQTNQGCLVPQWWPTVGNAGGGSGELKWMIGKWTPDGGGDGHVASLCSVPTSPSWANADVGHLLSMIMAGLRMGTPRINTFIGDATPGKTKVSFKQWYCKVQCIKDHCPEAVVVTKRFPPLPQVWKGPSIRSNSSALEGWQTWRPNSTSRITSSTRSKNTSWLCPVPVQYPWHIIFPTHGSCQEGREWKWGDFWTSWGNGQADTADCPVNGCPDPDQMGQWSYQHTR